MVLNLKTVHWPVWRQATKIFTYKTSGCFFQPQLTALQSSHTSCWAHWNLQCSSHPMFRGWRSTDSWQGQHSAAHYLGKTDISVNALKQHWSNSVLLNELPITESACFCCFYNFSPLSFIIITQLCCLTPGMWVPSVPAGTYRVPLESPHSYLEL